MDRFEQFTLKVYRIVYFSDVIPPLTVISPVYMKDMLIMTKVLVSVVEMCQAT